MTKLMQTFRWFGPNDEVTLADIRQTGATGIVTALHHIPCGEEWSVAEIKRRRDQITSSGLSWEIVESVNIHESIKTGEPERDHYIALYKRSLQNLATCGLKIVCYNFMPVLDWTRTHLDYRLPDNASALRYDAPALAAFELFILQRPEAFNEYNAEQQDAARQCFEGMTEAEKNLLSNTIMAGLPGTDEVFSVAEFRQHLQRYAKVGPAQLKENLAYFLRAIIPVAEAVGIKMCIHPDDPPFPILGLPRVVSTEEDLLDVVNFIPSASNGITLCTGSLGANPKNNLPAMIERLGPNIHFIHLRNVQRTADGSFYEAEHLDGSTDMFAVMQQIIKEQKRRENAGRTDIAIPMRPDHGHKILDDVHRNTYPGYSIIGRMKGLAELRGLELGIRRSLME